MTMAHRWAAMGTTMPIDGIEWSLSTGTLLLPATFIMIFSNSYGHFHAKTFPCYL